MLPGKRTSFLTHEDRDVALASAGSLRLEPAGELWEGKE